MHVLVCERQVSGLHERVKEKLIQNTNLISSGRTEQCRYKYKKDKNQSLCSKLHLEMIGMLAR